MISANNVTLRIGKKALFEDVNIKFTEGNCYGLIYGETDDFGPAGIITHIMNVEEIAQAMLDMAENEEMRLKMGENGYKRVMKKYRVEYMQKQYWEIYRDYAESMGLLWKEKPVELPKTDIKEIDIQD